VEAEGKFVARGALSLLLSLCIQRKERKSLWASKEMTIKVLMHQKKANKESLGKQRKYTQCL